jgi:uncharacterized protein (TIGR04255 family)
MSSKKTKKKISFEKPPLVEVVCGVQFAMLESFTVAHVGKLWECYESRFQESREQPALVSPIELMPQEQPTHQLVATLMPRTIFVADDKSAVLQVQRDAFYYNWQKSGPHDDYPRYEKVIERFESELAMFTDFIQKNSLGKIQPLQFELTYLNEFPMPFDTRRILRDTHWKDSGKRFLPDPESVNLAASFLFQDKILCRLHNNFRNTIKDGNYVYHWSLTARGCTNPRSKMDLAGVRSWFDEARDYIVSGFDDLADATFKDQEWGIL